MQKSICREIPPMPCATLKAHIKILILSSFSAGRQKTVLGNPNDVKLPRGNDQQPF